MKRSHLSLVCLVGLPLTAMVMGCSDEPQSTSGTTNPSGSGSSSASGGGGGDGGSAGSGGTGGQGFIRGQVSFATTPVLVARVGEPYLYSAKAIQDKPQAGDVISYSATKAPSGLVVGANGDVTWTPIVGQDGAHDVSLVATGPDGQTALQNFVIDVLPPVTIVAMGPAAGSAAGNELITILGSGFVGNVGVLFDQIPATDVMVLDDATLSVTTPPAIANTRIVRVTIDGVPLATFSPGFTHLPVITATDVASTPLFSTVKVYGVGFETAQIDPNQLTAPGRPGTRRKIVANQVVASELPFSLGPGALESVVTTGAVAVEVNGLRSNYVPLTISNAPIATELAVTGIDAPHAPGDTMTLFGAGFAGLAPASLTVVFAGSATNAMVTSIDAAGTSVAVTVPADARTGPISLAAPMHSPSKSHVAATITGSTPVLSILDITPSGGTPGKALVLRGTGFAANAASNNVTFDGMAATVLSVEPDRLVVEVPQLGFGPAQVMVNAGAQDVDAGIFGVTGTYVVRAGGGPDETEIGDDNDPLLASLESHFVTTDVANNYYLADRKRVRVINNEAAPLVIFGKTVKPNTIQTVVLVSENVTAIAIHPITQDIYFATGSRIRRAQRSDGVITDYAGSSTSGNGGNGGNRTNASFNGISDLAFTPSGGILLVADNNNGNIRAINTTGTPATVWGVNIAADAVDRIGSPGVVNPISFALDEEGSIYTPGFTQIRKIPFDRLAFGAPGYVESVLIAGNGNQNSLPAEGCPANTTPLGINNGIVIDPIRGDAFFGGRNALVRRLKKTGGMNPMTIDANDCIDFVAGSWDMAKAIPNAGYAGNAVPATSATLALFTRPFVDRMGSILLPAEGYLRRVLFDVNGNPGMINTIAGIGPSAVNNLPALSLRALSSLGSIRVDAANDRYIFSTGGRIVGMNRTTNLLTSLGGTAHLGNTIGANGMATSSDIGALRGFDVSAGKVYFLETVIPRIAMIDLGLGTLTVVAGDGVAATTVQQQTAGPAATSRVAINTGAPKVAVGPSGALYFADANVLRIINITAQPITTFGVTIAPGEIDDLPLVFGTNLSGVAFAPNGDLYVASYTTNAISRVRAAGPFVVETVIAGDGQDNGVPIPGMAATLKLNHPSDIHFLANGSLVIANDYSNTLIVVEPDVMGEIGPTSQFAHVFGSGAPGTLQADGFAHFAAPRNVRTSTSDGANLVIIAGDRVVELKSP